MRMKKLFKTIFILAVVMMYGIVSVNAQTLVFDPAVNENWYYHGVFYGRGIELKHGENKGNIYVTSEYYYYPGKWGQEHFPIYESTDGGKSFNHISDIYDTEFTKQKFMEAEDGTYYEVSEGSKGATTYYNEWWSMVYEPQLFELTGDLGELKKGTVICGGVTKADNHCAIVVYCSTDGLESWNYLGTIALGGKEQTGIGSAIWEPFFVYENNALYCFFSDERGLSAGGGQKLVYSKSTDGVNWGDAVDVCNFEWENNRFRPGMPVVTKLSDGRYFMVYEGVNMHGGYLPTYYKITDDIEKWRPTEREDGVLPFPLDGGSPYTVTMPDGTIVVGAHNTNKVAINTDNLETDTWTLIDTNIGNAYTRCLVSLLDGRLMIISGGAFSAPDPHTLTMSIEEIDIPALVDLTNATVTGTLPWGETEPNYDNSAENVIDGKSDTFFDGYPEGYVVIDMGREYNVSGIGYQPRFDFGFRTSGGMFYGSTDGVNWTKLYTIPTVGSNNALNYVDVESGLYRYIKYTSNGEEFCNMAEIKVYSEDVVKVNVNGKVLRYGEAPVVEDGNILLPLRVIAEEAKADVAWINSERSVAVILNDKLLKLPVDSEIYYLDGEEKTAYNKVRLINGTTYVSLDVIQEVTGGVVVAEGNRIYIRN